MDEDLHPGKFTRNYPTASCLIGSAILGLVFLIIAIPVGYYLLMLFLDAFRNA